MAISEIEKLERRFAENPQGLTFAPLAEAYRKSGDPQRALGILVQGLELHPDYIPASIVRGRCHLDLADDAAAELAFRHVLGLDAENVIALKALADVAERGQRPAEAAEWLRQLLVVDRSNDEAREQLARMEEAAAAAALAPPPPPLEAIEPETEAEELPVPPFQPVEELEAMELVPDESPAEPLVGTSDDGLALHEEATLAVGFFNEPLIRQPESESLVVSVPVVELPSLEPEPEPEVEPVAEESSVADGVLEVEPFDAVGPVGELGVVQLGHGEHIELEGNQHSEFQIASAADDLAGSSVLDVRGAAASEYQLPDASADFVAGGIDAGAERNEFQEPDASEALLASVRELDEPLVPPTFEASLHDDTPAAIEEAPVFAVPEASLGAPPVLEEPVVAGHDASSVDIEPVGQWATWSDAALSPDAEPFDAEAPVDVLAVVSEVEVVAVVEPLEAEATLESAEVVEVVEVEDVVEADVEPDLVVTESMAEIFERQGHPAEALRIYRALAERRPGDARLDARIAALEAGERAAAPGARYAARATGGTSVREMMRTILATRPNGVAREGQPDAPPRVAGGDAAPTRPAPDHLTLSAVFGDEGPPLPPAFRSARSAPSADAGGSFDEFFGTSSAAGGKSTRNVHAGTDDLDQFHTWLQNLKR